MDPGHDESWIVQDASRQARTPDVNIQEDASTAEYQRAEDDDRATRDSEVSYFDPPDGASQASFRESVRAPAGKKPIATTDSMEEPSLLGGSSFLAGKNELRKSGTDAGTRRVQSDEVSIRIHRDSRTVRESAGSIYHAASPRQSVYEEDEVPAGKQGAQKASAADATYFHAPALSSSIHSSGNSNRQSLHTCLLHIRIHFSPHHASNRISISTSLLLTRMMKSRFPSAVDRPHPAGRWPEGRRHARA